MIRFAVLLMFVAFVALFGCKSYKQDYMFGWDKNKEGQLSQLVDDVEKNYVIQNNDLLGLQLFTNKGERIIDPNFELVIPNNQVNQLQRNNFEYLVQIDGGVKLPILGKVELEGLTLQEAETKLEESYDEYYKDSYVRLTYKSKRVIVLGASGGQVIPLPYENISLVEVIAMTGGISEMGKAHNIRLVRGDLSNPAVYQVDLSTIDGMKASVINVEPGDIIYIEPRRREFFLALRDISPILSLVTSIITLALILSSRQ